MPSLAECQRQLYWIACVIELPYLWIGSCGVLREDEVHTTPLSCQTTKCWSTQWGLTCEQARELEEKNHVSILCMIGFLLVIDYLH